MVVYQLIAANRVLRTYESVTKAFMWNSRLCKGCRRTARRPRWKFTGFVSHFRKHVRLSICALQPPILRFDHSFTSFKWMFSCFHHNQLTAAGRPNKRRLKTNDDYRLLVKADANSFVLCYYYDWYSIGCWTVRRFQLSSEDALTWW